MTYALGDTIPTEYDYDAASQLIATAEPDSAYRFTYDLFGRLETVDNTGTPGGAVWSWLLFMFC